MDITKVKLRELVLSNRAFKKSLNDYSDNQTLYEIIIDIKQRLKKHEETAGLNNLEAMKLLNLLSGTYFFVKDYDAVIDISNKILSLTPFDQNMLDLMFLTKVNLYKAYHNKKDSENCFKVATQIIDEKNYNFDEKNANNELNKFILELLIFVSQSQNVTTEKSISCLEEVYAYKHLIPEGFPMDLFIDDLILKLKKVEDYERVKTIILENTIFTLIENLGMKEGEWDEKSNALKYEESDNDVVRNKYASIRTINDMFLIMQGCKLDKVGTVNMDFVPRFEEFQENDFDIVLSRTLNLHHLEEAFILEHNPNYKNYIWRYKLDYPITNSSSTLMLRYDLLAQLADIMKSKIMISMPTCQELLITKYDEDMLIKFFALTMYEKVKNQFATHTGSRDIFVYNGGTSIERLYYEKLMPKFDENVFIEIVRQAEKTLIEEYPSKKTCFCGSEKKFKACCGKYFK